MQFATVNGVMLHYQVIGAPEGRPLVVFANSLGTDFRIWRDVIVRLAGDVAILTYDKRGHGLSGIGKAPYTLDDHADDLAALLDHLDQKNAIVVGLSVGGMIAQLLASKRPDLTRALVLCDTAHKIGDDATWNSRIEAIESGGIESVADAVMERWFTKPWRENNPDELAGYRNMLTRQTVAGYNGTCAAIRDADLTASSAALDLPVACVVGDGDLSTPPSLMLELARLIPGAHYDVIKEAGHIPCVEQPVVLADILKAFITDLISQ